jgi:hypothetical protein
MKIRHALVASVALSSALGLVAAPAAQANDATKSVTFAGLTDLQVGGPWSEGSVTLANTSATDDTTDHLVLRVGYGKFALDQFAVEYAQGASGDWKPLTFAAAATGDPRWTGGIVDVTGAAVDLKAKSSQTIRLRMKLPQSDRELDPQDIPVEGVLASSIDAFQHGEHAADGEKQVKPGGLTTTISGLPAQIPLDGKAHPFQITIKSANHFDWHIDHASFLVFPGQGIPNSDNGLSACDGEVDVQDPATGSWHKVGTRIAGLEGEDVDLAHWATGPVDDRVLNVRISLGKNYKSDPKTASLGFGYYPGEGPNYFWTMQGFTTTPVAGAPDCVDPNGSGTPSPAPAAATTPVATPTATPTATAQATASTGRTLAFTGSTGTGLVAGLGAGLLAVGAGVLFLMRRRGRRA